MFLQKKKNRNTSSICMPAHCLIKGGGLFVALFWWVIFCDHVYLATSNMIYCWMLSFPTFLQSLVPWLYAVEYAFLMGIFSQFFPNSSSMVICSWVYISVVYTFNMLNVGFSHIFSPIFKLWNAYLIISYSSL